ncbi:hypothetical protein GCM10020331_039970 [Ectobacillus funiculus]
MYSSEEKANRNRKYSNMVSACEKKAPLSSHSLEWKDKQFSGVIVYERFSAPFQEWYIVKKESLIISYIKALEKQPLLIF